MLTVELWHAIFDMLPIQDLLSNSLTCTCMRAYVRGYWHSAFNLPRLLHHFIPHESVPAFRTLLQTTGGIISGSVALQYLDRRTFQQADLDIYVVQDKWTEVIEWLLCHGLVSVNAEDSKLEDSEEVDVAEGYTGRSDVESVVDFNNKQTARIVQVVSTKRNPVYAVLQFHSCEQLYQKFLNNAYL